MRANFNKKISLTYFCFSLLLAILISPLKVDAIEVNFDGLGQANTGYGTNTNRNIDGKFHLHGCWAVKVNLVKLGDSGPEWVTFYYLFADDTGTGKSNLNIFKNTKWSGVQTNLITTTTGDVGVVGQIYSSGYSATGAFAADVKTLGDIGESASFFSPSDGGLIGTTFDVGKLKRSVVGIGEKATATDTFFRVLYALLTTNRQRNSSQWPDIDMSGITSWSALKTSMEEQPEKWISLSNYRIVFEPIYRWKKSDREFLFTTLKSGAYYLSASQFSGVNRTQFINNCYTTEAHGTIQPGTAVSDLTGSINVNSGRGYAIVKIVDDVKMCDPKTSCCYDSSGTYKGTPVQPEEDGTTYKCNGTINEDKTCAGTLEVCDMPTEEPPSNPQCDPAKGETIYNFNYMFLAALDETTTEMHNTGEGTSFVDKDILKTLKDTNGKPIVSNTQLKDAYANASRGKVTINKDNLAKFYDKLAAAGSSSNRYTMENNGTSIDYYISYDTWCSISAAGTTCWDAVTGAVKSDTTGTATAKPAYSGFDKQSHIKASVNAATTTIKEQTAEGGLGYKLSIDRTFRAYPSGRPWMMNTSQQAVKENGSYLHPAMYRISFCIPENPEPDCDDDVNQATCYASDDGTHAIFHENDDLKTCTIPKDNESGFTAIEQDETVAPNKSNAYCEVACKEDLNIDLPTSKKTAAGQYFLLNNYIPKIEATRTCVTTKVNYDEFDNDLKVYESRMPEEYNEWQDNLDLYTHFSTGSSSNKSGTAATQPYSYTSTEVPCKEPCPASNPSCTPAEHKYTKEVYKINGTEYTYISGCTECGIAESGKTFIDKYKEVKGYSSIKDADGNEVTDPSIILQDERNKNPSKNGASEISGAASKSGNSSGIGEVVKGTDTCTYTTGTAPNLVSHTATYNWENWVIYKYDAINYSRNNYAVRTGYYESTTACSGTGITYDTAVGQEISKYSGRTSSTFGTYINDYDDYRETINTYNLCFNWTDPTDNAGRTGYNSHAKGSEPRIQKGRANNYEDYYYKFKPEVSFDYPDNYGRGGMDAAVFPVVYTYDYNKDVQNGIGIGVGTYPKTKSTYWGKGEETDVLYSGGSSIDNKSPSAKGLNTTNRTVLDCNGETCSTSQTVDFEFYDSSYMRRDETATYEYHLPQIYTKVPSGIVSTDERLERNATWLALDKEAVPININTPAGDYEYTITIKKLVNEEDGDIRFTKHSNNPDDNFEDRFNGATGNGALNAGSDYICNYNVKNDVYIPDPSKYNFFYRTIDPYDINPLNRTLGYNWSDSRGQQVQDVIAEEEADYQLLTSKDKFEFTLTSSLMKKLREYNKTKNNTSDGAYADWDMVCDDYDQGGYHCYSNVLSCIASAGTVPQAGTGLNCSELSDALADYREYSDYDLGELNANRSALIAKQNALDGR